MIIVFTYLNGCQMKRKLGLFYVITRVRAKTRDGSCTETSPAAQIILVQTIL